MVFSSSGPLDKDGCHRNESDARYHCHIKANVTAQAQSLVGFKSVSDVWLYSNGPMNVFSGVAIGADLANKYLGIHGSISTLSHQTGDHGYRLNGFDAGIKLGPNLNLIGLHPFVDVGYFRQIFVRVNDTTHHIGGLQYGAGAIWNFDQVSVDLKILKKSTTDLEKLWLKLGAPGVTEHLQAQLGVYLRF